jgi:DNA (cytosine-5)-methyltransferase 1
MSNSTNSPSSKKADKSARENYVSNSASSVKSTMPYMSLFSGCGGFDLGIESTGFFEAIMCVELESSYFSTLKNNQGRKFFGYNFLSRAQLINDDVFAEPVVEKIKARLPQSSWLMAAGPPCQSFSTLGNRNGISDPRGNLTLRFFELVTSLLPTFFVFENVPPLGQKAGETLRPHIFEILEKAGYFYEGQIVNMADYGCSTKRKRYIIVGSLERRIGFPNPTHSENGTLFLPPWRTSHEALDGLPDPRTSHNLSHHDVVTHTEAVKNRFESLQLGQYDRKRHRSKLDPSKPGPTLVAGGSGGYVHHIHWLSRELTSRESARLHGFPDDFVLSGSKLDVAKQIANSIPIEFGRTIGNWLHNVAS